MTKLAILVVLALVSLVRLASAATYTEALAAAKLADACYIEQSASGSGWTVVQECDDVETLKKSALNEVPEWASDIEALTALLGKLAEMGK